MALCAAVGLSLVVRAIRAAADVIEVDAGDGFCASVYVSPDGGVSVARLDRSLRGAPDEGEVLRWTMEHAAGLYGSGLFVHRRSPGR